MAQPMTTDEALKIVLELAEGNVLTERQAWIDELVEQRELQIRAVAIVRVAFRVT